MGKYREKPIKWSYTEINQGYKTIDNTKIFFNEELLKLDTIIKIEIAMFNGIEFIPISNVYEYYIEKQGINQEKETRDDVKKLDDDIRKYSSDEHLNLMKVCKRLFVKALQHKNMSLKNKLILLFKSDIGKLYRVKSEIDCIISVIETRDNHTENDNLLQDINDALQNILSVLSSTQYKFNEKFYSKMVVTNNFSTHKLLKVYNILMKLINIEVHKYITTNNIMF